MNRHPYATVALSSFKASFGKNCLQSLEGHLFGTPCEYVVTEINCLHLSACHEKSSPARRRQRLSVTKNDHFLTLYQGEVIEYPPVNLFVTKNHHFHVVLRRALRIFLTCFNNFLTS